jgi:hypothetical protein
MVGLELEFVLRRESGQASLQAFFYCPSTHNSLRTWTGDVSALLDSPIRYLRSASRDGPVMSRSA